MNPNLQRILMGLNKGMSYNPNFPSTLANLEIWLDSAALNTLWSDTAGTIQATPGGSVARWDNRTGSGYNAISSTSTRRPMTGLYSLNGKNCISFDGSDDILSFPSNLYFLPNGSNTVLIVAQANQAADGVSARRLFNGLSTANSNYGIIPLPQQNGLSVRNGGSSTALAYTKDNDPHIWGMRRQTNMIYGYRNGLVGTASNGSNVSTLTELSIGHNVAATASQAWNGYICEILAYSRSLSNAEINSICQDYINPKWGLSWTNL